VGNVKISPQRAQRSQRLMLLRFVLCALAPMRLKEKSPPWHRELEGDELSLRPDLQDRQDTISLGDPVNPVDPV